MSLNPFALLRNLLATPALQVGDVLAIEDGVAIVELPGGGRITARGSAAVGARVFVRDGAIEGTAPSLPIVDISV